MILKGQKLRKFYRIFKILLLVLVMSEWYAPECRNVEHTREIITAYSMFWKISWQN
jgi:hypothetical protein